LTLRRRDIRGLAALCVACALTAPAVPGFESPLTPASLHEAWVLGQRNDQATGDFLAPYAKQVARKAQSGPHLAEIEILTPFSQVVDESRRNPSGYSEAQATRDYHRRGDHIVVGVLLMLPAAYPKPEDDSSLPPGAASQAKKELRPENFWRNFHFNVKQQGKPIAPRSIQSIPVYSAATKDAPSVLDGANVRLSFDASDVRSEEIVIDVITPDTEVISATFDLKSLR
jgi:hypothetical protein